MSTDLVKIIQAAIRSDSGRTDVYIMRRDVDENPWKHRGKHEDNFNQLLFSRLGRLFSAWSGAAHLAVESASEPDAHGMTLKDVNLEGLQQRCFWAWVQQQSSEENGHLAPPKFMKIKAAAGQRCLFARMH